MYVLKSVVTCTSFSSQRTNVKYIQEGNSGDRWLVRSIFLPKVSQIELHKCIQQCHISNMGKQFEREREIERARERNRTEARIVNMENC